MREDDPHHWEGNTDALVRRISEYGPGARTARLQGVFKMAAIAAGFLAVAAFFANRAVQPPSFHVVTTGEDRLMWVNQRTGLVGGCLMNSERVRCVRTDWSSGPLDYDDE